jgi:hypothetical protein
VAASAPATTGFVRHREPPADWVARLAEVSPKSDEQGWLKLVWEAGEEWIPGQRWTLYEMVHEQFVDPVVLAELRGPHPRSEGHMCSTNVPKQFQCLCRHKFEGWRGGPCQIITLKQWELWRETGYFGQCFWVIQGEKGGHKRVFPEEEVEMLKLADLPLEPPGVGELPYAPFDERVVAHIHRNNRLVQLGISIGEYRRKMTGAEYQLERERVARSLRAEYVKWFEEQLGEASELFVSAARKGQMDDAPRTEIDYDRAYQEGLQQYIETGILPDDSQFRSP